MDISILDLNSTALDSAVRVCFAPAPRGELLVSTSSNKILVLDAKTGRLVREVGHYKIRALRSRVMWGFGTSCHCGRLKERRAHPGVHRLQRKMGGKRVAILVWLSLFSVLSHSCALAEA